MIHVSDCDVSQVSLMLHVAVPELRSSTFGWMKCSHLFSMLWSYSILFVVYLWGLDLVTRYPASCRFLGGFHACAPRAFFLFLAVLRFGFAPLTNESGSDSGSGSESRYFRQ